MTALETWGWQARPVKWKGLRCVRDGAELQVWADVDLVAVIYPLRRSGVYEVTTVDKGKPYIVCYEDTELCAMKRLITHLTGIRVLHKVPVEGRP